MCITSGPKEAFHGRGIDPLRPPHRPRHAQWRTTPRRGHAKAPGYLEKCGLCLDRVNRFWQLVDPFPRASRGGEGGRLEGWHREAVYIDPEERQAARLPDLFDRVLTIDQEPPTFHDFTYGRVQILRLQPLFCGVGQLDPFGLPVALFVEISDEAFRNVLGNVRGYAP